MNKKIIKRLRHGASSYNFLNKFSVNFERSDPPVGLTASKSDKNLKENLSRSGASQKILNKILKDFERSDLPGRPHGLKIIKKLNKKIIKGFAPA